MKTHVNYYPEIPKEYDYCYGTPQEFDEYDLKNLKEYDFDEVYYWYASGSYEGSGAMLAKKDGKWTSLDLGHCSCNGPLEYCNVTYYDSLDALRKTFSEHSMKEFAVLFDMAEKSISKTKTLSN